MSCCAFLQLASEDSDAALPQLLQVNGMRLEEPELGDSVVERTGSRIFFTTSARDFSRSCIVGVFEAAVLSFIGLTTLAEAQNAHDDGAVSSPPFANCRLLRRTREVAAELGSNSTGRVCVNTTVVAAVPLSLQMSQAPNTSYHTVLDILRQCPENHDAMLAAHLSEIHG